MLQRALRHRGLLLGGGLPRSAVSKQDLHERQPVSLHQSTGWPTGHQLHDAVLQRAVLCRGIELRQRHVHQLQRAELSERVLHQSGAVRQPADRPGVRHRRRYLCGLQLQSMPELQQWAVPLDVQHRPMPDLQRPRAVRLGV